MPKTFDKDRDLMGSNSKSLSRILGFIVTLCILQFFISIVHSMGGPFTNEQGLLSIPSVSDGQRSLFMNPDEESNFQIAQNFLEGNGYTKLNSERGIYEPSSFHSPSTVFLYQIILMTDADFDAFIIFYFFLSAFFHGFSLFYIYKILESEGVKWATLGVVMWGIFPSSLYYINTLFLYESLTTSLLIIFVYRISSLQKKGWGVELLDIFILFILALTMAFFRYHTIPILLATIFFLFLFNDRIKRAQAILLAAVVFSAVFLAITPALYKNYIDFGRAIVTTQTGEVLWQGANPYARGSWDGAGAVSKLGLEDMPNLQGATELQKSDHLTRKAFLWIISSPDEYALLTLRKLAIFFLPQNFEGGLPGNRWYNPMNALVYSFFVASIFFWGRFKRQDKWLFIAPVLGSIALTLVSFVGYRWRFYAEPFMTILAVLAFKHVLLYVKGRLKPKCRI